MRTDLLSKRLYIAGCFGLPWLWIVHVLYWRSNETEENEGLLNPDDHFQDSPTEMTAEEIQVEAQKWVNRCKYSAIVVVSLWIGWIVTAQLLRNSVIPANWYVLSPDDQALTGW